MRRFLDLVRRGGRSSPRFRPRRPRRSPRSIGAVEQLEARLLLANNVLVSLDPLGSIHEPGATNGLTLTVEATLISVRARV